MKSTEINNPDTDNPTVWEANPWNLPYDIAHVQSVSTMPPTPEQFWGEEKETPRILKLARGLGHAAVRGVNVGIAGIELGLSTAPLVAATFGGLKEASWRGIDGAASLVGFSEDGKVRQFSSNNVKDGRILKEQGSNEFRDTVSGAFATLNEPTHGKDLDRIRANSRLDAAQVAHEDGNFEEATRHMKEATLHKQDIKNRGLKKRIKSWWQS